MSARFWMAGAVITIAGMIAVGCVDGESGYNGYQQDYTRPRYDQTREDRRESNQRRYERQLQGAYDDRQEYGRDAEGPNVVRIPNDSDGY